MFLAIKSDNKKITDFFLDLYEEKRIDLFKDERSSDILSIAIANRFIDVEIIAKFIAQGANINGIDDQGLNPLLSAVVYNKKDILSLLLKKYDEEEVNPFRNEMNIGIINFAIEHNPNPEILEILINAGAYLRFRDADGKKPLENIIDRALEFPLNSQYQNGAVFLVISHAILDVDFNSESMRKFYAEILLPENRFATEKFLKNLNQISKVLREEGGLSFTEILSLGINQDDILLAINVVTKDRYPTMNEDDLKIMIEREFENPDFNLLARNIFRLKKEGKTPDTKACVFYADAAYKGPETTVGK